MDRNHLSADILKILGQPTRIKIIDLLRDGERCVCEIYPAIHEEQSNTSRHLNLMVAAGILRRRKEGAQTFYGIKHPEIFRMVDLAADIARLEADHRIRSLGRA